MLYNGFMRHVLDLSDILRSAQDRYTLTLDDPTLRAEYNGYKTALTDIGVPFTVIDTLERVVDGRRLLADTRFGAKQLEEGEDVETTILALEKNVEALESQYKSAVETAEGEIHWAEYPVNPDALKPSGVVP
jgi:hypothetical protein